MPWGVETYEPNVPQVPQEHRRSGRGAQYMMQCKGLLEAVASLSRKRFLNSMCARMLAGEAAFLQRPPIDYQTADVERPLRIGVAPPFCFSQGLGKCEDLVVGCLIDTKPFQSD